MSDLVHFPGNFVGGHSAQPSIDRARGGKIELKLTIPSKTYSLKGPCGGKATLSKMEVTIVIDIEELPLVNTSGYSTGGWTQNADDELPYEPLKLEGDFS